LSSNLPPGTTEGSEAARPRRRALRALRHREFRIFWAGLIISVMGTWMQMAAQGWLVLELTNSPLSLGVVGACASFPMLVFSLPAGVIADRIAKRNIVLVTQTAAMMQAFALAALVYSGLVQVWHVMVLAGVLGTINAFDMTTRHAMVIELASHEDALNAVSLNSTAFQTGRMVGPAVGGLLMAKAGVAACFLVNGITFLPMLAALLFIAPRPPGGAAAGALVPHIGEGLRWAASRPVPRTLLALLGVSSLFAMPYMVLLPVLARDVFHVGPEAYGVMFSVPGVGAFLAAVALTARGHPLEVGGDRHLRLHLLPLDAGRGGGGPRLPRRSGDALSGGRRRDEFQRGGQYRPPADGPGRPARPGDEPPHPPVRGHEALRQPGDRRGGGVDRAAAGAGHGGGGVPGVCAAGLVAGARVEAQRVIGRAEGQESPPPRITLARDESRVPRKEAL